MVSFISILFLKYGINVFTYDRERVGACIFPIGELPNGKVAECPAPKLIDVVLHAKYSICEFYLVESFTWAEPGQNSEIS